MLSPIVSHQQNGNKQATLDGWSPVPSVVEQTDNPSWVNGYQPHEIYNTDITGNDMQPDWNNEEQIQSFEVGDDAGSADSIPIGAVKKPTNTFKVPSELGVLLGDLEKNQLAITLIGDQGAGKTQLAFQIMDKFAMLPFIRRIDFYSLEIGASSNIIVKNTQKYLSPQSRSKIFISEEADLEKIREKAETSDMIVIDSWTKLDADSSEFDRLRKDYPNCIFLVIFQSTSGRKIRGGTKPLFDAGINLEVRKVDTTFVNNYAEATKNRYGATGILYNIAHQKIMR